MSLPAGIRRQLKSLFDSEVIDVQPASGGCISTANVIRLSDNQTYFLKFLEHAPAEFFTAEAAGLSELRAAKAMIVPEVRHTATDDTVSWILMEALTQGAQSRDAEEEFGRGLAKLHSCRGSRFGFSADNYIGLTPQKNLPSSAKDGSGEAELSWEEFFLQYRLLLQIRLGQKNSWFTETFADTFKAIENVVLRLLSEYPEPPTLLHGDLWSGNIFWSTKGPALIDPAVYYGNREADLAFMQLFSSPPRRVLQAYEEMLPLSPGFEDRKVVLNLYHLMNHANLFGGSYIGSVRETLHMLAKTGA